MVELFANSGNPHQTPHSVVSDLGMHCLPITLLGVSRLQWVKNVQFLHPLQAEWQIQQTTKSVIDLDISCTLSPKRQFA